MAALFLHNALFIPEIEPPYSPHSRTVSSGTLRTIATSISYPTEPLLYDSTTLASSAYHDILSRQPSHPSRPTGWDMGLSLESEATTMRERQGYWEKATRRRLQVLKTIKIIFELMMGIWAVYNTVRYFLAYRLYDSMDGQTISIVLGTATGLAFTFLVCSAALSALQTRLMAHHIPIRVIIGTGTALRSISAFLLVIPALINVVLIGVWRNSTTPEMGVRQRCHLDIDLVWSLSHKPCQPGAPWTVWLGISIIRLCITVVIIILHYSVSSTYQDTRRPSLSKLARAKRRRTFPSLDQSYSISPFVPETALPTAPRDSAVSQASSSSSSSSDEDLTTEMSQIQTLNMGSNPDGDLHSFVDRFRSLVSQISRETEDGLNLATRGSPEDIYTPLPQRHLSANEYGEPYRPDEPARIMQTFVRRMPTIESLGSREIASSIASSSMVRHSSLYTSSRPPTRSNTLEYSPVEGPSRANSLSQASAGFGPGDGISEDGVWDPAAVKQTGSNSTSRSWHSAHSPSSAFFAGPPSGVNSDNGHYTLDGGSVA